MAPRQPRKPPQPPNRSRARTPGKRQPVEPIGEGEAPPLVGRRSAPPPRIITPRSDKLADAVEAFELGDDSLLFQYQPTASSNPNRPRTEKAGYDSKTHELRVMFREGAAKNHQTAIYVYYDIEPRVWQRFKKSSSPGKFINRVLSSYEYNREY